MLRFALIAPVLDAVLATACAAPNVYPDMLVEVDAIAAVPAS